MMKPMFYKKNTSFYELYYFKWCGIDYDRKKLIKFLKRFWYLKIFSLFLSSYRREFKILKEILNIHDKNKIQGLLNNDEEIVRLSLIEKWARIGAIEILIDGKFSKKTYKTITNLPSSDFKLLLKRVQELIDLSQDVFIQDESTTSQIPGA